MVGETAVCFVDGPAGAVVVVLQDAEIGLNAISGDRLRFEQRMEVLPLLQDPLVIFIL
jgi:hypothetical protein